MDRIEAYKIVLEDMKKCNLFCGKYDAKHGSKKMMSGIRVVMEFIAYRIDDETGDDFTNNFSKNLIASEERAKNG